MDYRIEDKPAFTFAGKPLKVSMASGSNMHAIPEFWGSTPPTERLYTLQKPDGVIGKAVLGACADFNAAENAFTYYIAVEADEDTDFGDYDKREVPPATWAVFESVGPVVPSIQKVWQRIFSEFFPTSDYAQAPGIPQIEYYPAPADVDAADYRCEVWIPVVKK